MIHEWRDSKSGMSFDYCSWSREQGSCEEDQEVRFLKKIGRESKLMRTNLRASLEMITPAKEAFWSNT